MSDERKNWLDRVGVIHLWNTIKAALDDKVDKIEGMGLSSNDFTTEEKKKLETLSDPAVASAENNGLMSAADKIKLDGIEKNATHYIHPSYEEKQAGVYRISVDKTGHVATADKMTADELKAEGISPAGHTHDYAGANEPGGAAINAITATQLSGFTARTGQKWGNQVGEFVHGEDDSSSGSFAFRSNNPVNGEMSMLINGRFYQNQGKYMVLDTNNFSDYALSLNGGQIQGRIERNAGGSFIQDRNNTVVFGSGTDTSAGGSYYPVIGQKTVNGTQTIGCLSGSDTLFFNYVADTDYEAGNNNSSKVTLPICTGEIVTTETMAASVGAIIYPVGSIYMSVSSTSPAVLFGGTWEQLKDRFLLGAGSSYTAGNTGGAATVALSKANMPSYNLRDDVWVGKVADSQGSEVKQLWSGRTGTQQTSVSTGGSNTPHNNMPPYLVVYMWKRTA